MNERHYNIIKNSFWAVFCIVTVLPALFIAIAAICVGMHWLAWLAENALRRACGMPQTEFSDYYL